MKKILLVYVEDSCNNNWVDSCWTEDKEKEAICHALEIREKGFRSAVLSHVVNVTSSRMGNEWDFDLEEMLLEWDR